MVTRIASGTCKKPNLPDKICLFWERPFAWRKKWRTNWDGVKTYSLRCKSALNREVDLLA